jgi:hypothetical protein
VKIDPRKSVPQAPRVLRAGSKGYARAKTAEAAGDPPPDEQDDDDDDEEEEDPDSQREEASYSLDDHEPARADAEAKCAAASEAWKASKGTDSAAALMAAEAASAEARTACEAAEGSSQKLRGVPPPLGPDAAAKPVAPPPTAAPPGAISARAIVKAAGTPDAAAHVELLAAATFGRKMKALFGGASFDESEGIARAAHQDAREAVGLRAAAVKAETAAKKRAEKDADAKLHATLLSAVKARKYARAELFDVSANAAGAEVLTPQAWTKAMSPEALTSMIAKKQARADLGGGPGPTPDETPVHISSAVADYCRARGITDPTKIAALAAELSSGAVMPQETAR